MLMGPQLPTEAVCGVLWVLQEDETTLCTHTFHFRQLLCNEHRDRQLAALAGASVPQSSKFTEIHTVNTIII